MPDTPVTVIGAGVVGLAVAARLAPRHPDLVVLERNAAHGMETSSRNSEVIHAGLYYPEGSLKAQLCVEGNRLLYELCAARSIGHRRTGKLVIATSEEEGGPLLALSERAAANGAPVERVTGAEIRRLEPALRAVAGLSSPSSGIVSAHGLMDELLAQARAAGAHLQTSARVVALERDPAGWRLEVESPAGRESFTSERVVNAAGLDADRVAALAGVDLDGAGYRLHWAKGSYFAASSVLPFSHLVYPLPQRESLGVHAVLGLDGRLRFGPDLEYLSERRPDYRVDESRRAAFADAVRRWLPELEDNQLAPDIAGIRPKLQGPGDPFRDFVIREESDRGLPGLIDLVGIDSPGLTSALAIAERVARL
jgi:L-2-hydroxyglutarate oxidase LhgO